MQTIIKRTRGALRRCWIGCGIDYDDAFTGLHLRSSSSGCIYYICTAFCILIISPLSGLIFKNHAPLLIKETKFILDQNGFTMYSLH